jgi:hypothetical protein
MIGSGALERSLAKFKAAWPRVKIGDETVRAYIWGLHDLPELEVEETIEYAIRTCTFPPTIAELRALYAERILGLPDPGHALELVEAHVAAGDLALGLPGPVKRALKALGGSWSWRQAENPSVMRAHFLKLYEEFRRQAILEVTAPRAIEPRSVPELTT